MSTFASTLITESIIGLPMPPRRRVVHLLLLMGADRDGVVQVHSNRMAEVAGCTRREAYSDVLTLQKTGVIALYTVETNGITSGWAWIPHSSEQPARGALARPRDPSRPAPPRDAVVETLTKLWGRDVSEKEAKAACPRAWGKVRAGTTAAAAPAVEVERVFAAWRDRQTRPGACRLGDGARRLIVSAIREASADDLVTLFRYAYEADTAEAQFWQGKNSRGQKYLALNNLLVKSKLSGRIQNALEWAASRPDVTHAGEEDDGTDLGPMARFRAGYRAAARSAPADDPDDEDPAPAGTNSTPRPRPKRLSEQCRKMVELFRERGDAGVRTSELAAIALKYTGRISEIRGAGAEVRLTERDPDGNNLYVMLNHREWNGLD